MKQTKDTRFYQVENLTKTMKAMVNPRLLDQKKQALENENVVPVHEPIEYIPHGRDNYYYSLTDSNNSKQYAKVSKRLSEQKDEEESSEEESEEEINSLLKSSAIFEVDNQFIVTSSPHTFSNITTKKIMLDVLIALLPASIAAVVIFGLKALILILTCTASAVIFEWIFQKICKRHNTIGDLSAAVTGLLLALNLPASVPWWQGVVGSLIAIVVVKGLFGGLGKNFANPAITARVMMLLAFSATMNAVVQPEIIEITSSATPLPIIKENNGRLPNLLYMIVGLKGGAIGETSAIALLLGGIYLMAKRVITWHTPIVYIGTVFLMILAIYQDAEMALYHIFAGGLFIGAFFMATDYSTTPSRPWGKVIFAIGCAIITVAIRVWGSYPEGVSFSILFMNLLTPYIDKWVQKKPFGGVKYEH